MINTADEKTTPLQDMIKGARENLKGFVSDVQSRRMSMLGTRERSTRGIMSKDGYMKRKGVASDGQGMVAKAMSMIPRPFGFLKAPAAAGNGTGTGTPAGGGTGTSATETTEQPGATYEATVGARRLTGH